MKKKTLILLKYIVLIVLVMIFVSPVILEVVSSFKSQGDIYDASKVFSLRGLGLDSWRRAINEENFLGD